MCRSCIRAVAVATLAWLVAGVPGTGRVDAQAPERPDTPEPTEVLDEPPAPPPLPPAPRPLLLVAVNVDGAQVTLDEQPLGDAPLAPAEVDAGSHRLSITAPGYERYARTIEVSGDFLRVDVRLVPAADAPPVAEERYAEVRSADGPLWKKWWLWAAVGGAVALATVIGVAVGASRRERVTPGFPVPPIPGRSAMRFGR